MKKNEAALPRAARAWGSGRLSYLFPEELNSSPHASIFSEEGGEEARCHPSVLTANRD